MTRDLTSYLTAQRERVEAALDRYLSRLDTGPHLLRDAVRYSLLAGGKRLRPVLALAAAEAVVGSEREHEVELALPAACAIEMIHTYSLVHDDLPAMDDDSLRRGRPTSHVVYGQGIAILAGDALLTEAFGLLAREPRQDDAGVRDRKLRTIALVASSAGAAGMVGGQVIDLQATDKVPDDSRGTITDRAALERMHAWKTGALIRAAAGSGAIMAGASDAQLTAIDEYARELGLAFQIRDDILDVEGASAVLGKTAGKDAASNKPTYPTIFGLEESRRLAQECIRRSEAALARASLEGRLAEIARWVIRRVN